MKLVLFNLSMILLFINVSSAAVTTFDLDSLETVNIKCRDSVPFLKGSMLRCEVLCKVQIIQTYKLEEDCDQTCWSVNTLSKTEVTVTKFPSNEILFSHIEMGAASGQKDVDTAMEIADQACSRIDTIRAEK